MDRTAETKAIKAALAGARIAARVSHGHGTAYGWIYVDVGQFHRDCPCTADYRYPCRDEPGDPCGERARYNALTVEAMRVTASATGRNPARKYNDRIIITTQDARVVQVGRWAAAPVRAA